jgi:hypothetical protein
MSKAGRKRVEGGVRRMWTVPPDIDAAVQQRGTKWLWQIARVVLAYESTIVVNADDANNVLSGENVDTCPDG